MLVKLDHFLQLFKVQIAKIQEYHLIPVQFCWESKLVPTPPLIKDLIKNLVCHKFLQQKVPSPQRAASPWKKLNSQLCATLSYRANKTLISEFDRKISWIHPGRLTWNLQITHEKKGKWSSKPPWLWSMLIFQCVPVLDLTGDRKVVFLWSFKGEVIHWAHLFFHQNVIVQWDLHPLKFTWQWKTIMNEDVSPIKKGWFSNVMLVFSGVHPENSWSLKMVIS